MAEATPEAIWTAIARSPMLSTYVYEMHWLAADVVRRADALFGTD